MSYRSLACLVAGLFMAISLGSCTQKEGKDQSNASQNQGKQQRALIQTNKGDITIELYNSTPKHRDNFIKLVKEHYYDGLLFHRVMDQFMIQGGDPDSRNAAPGQPLGVGGPPYQIDAEVGSPHIYGAVAAARTPNPEKKSSGSQFYIVTGVKQSESQLQQIEQMKNVKYNEVQRKIYLEQGGYPGLDMDYTVFGKVISGMEVVEAIDQVQTDERNRPLENIVITTIKLID